MPYKSINELPKQVKDNLPKHAQEIYKEAYNNKSIYTKLTADIKDSAVTIVDANGGQVFTTYKGHNVHAQTKHKEYFTIDLKKLQEDHPSIYNKYKTKEVHSITLEVNTVKI